MADANPRWGAPRIHGELLKLGIDVSQATVAKYIVRPRPSPSQTWRTFLANQVGQIVAADFFVVLRLADPVRGSAAQPPAGIADPDAMHARCAADARQCPPESTERQNLLLFVWLQDVAHRHEGLHVPAGVKRLGCRPLIVGFELSTNCPAVSTSRRNSKTEYFGRLLPP